MQGDGHRGLFREPRGGVLHGLRTIAGCLALGYALFLADALDRPFRLMVMALGVSLLLMGAAEFLPRNRAKTAGTLRLFGNVALVAAMLIAAFNLLPLLS